MEKETVQVIDVIERLFNKETALQELVDHLEEQCKANPNYEEFLGVCKDRLKRMLPLSANEYLCPEFSESINNYEWS